jgi:hypothetical protein
MKEIICIILVLLAFSVLAYSKEPEVITQNSFFEDGLENWEFILSGGALAEAETDDSDSVKGSQCAYLDLKMLGGSVGFWEIRFAQSLFDVIEAGKMYTLSVWAKGEDPRQIRPHLRVGQPPSGPWDSQHAQTFDITTEWAEYSHSFSAGGEPDGVVDVALGTTLGNLWMDNIRLYEGTYVEDLDLGRTLRISVESSGKLATTWASIKRLSRPSVEP